MQQKPIIVLSDLLTHNEIRLGNLFLYADDNNVVFYCPIDKHIYGNYVWVESKLTLSEFIHLCGDLTEEDILGGYYLVRG